MDEEFLRMDRAGFFLPQCMYPPSESEGDSLVSDEIARFDLWSWG